MSQLATVYDLPDLVVFDVSGADAVSFMQGQITNDIAGAAPNCGLLAGYCTAQGRLLATMVLHHARPMDDGTPVLRGLIKQDILTPVLKRLSMFVMRAKAKLAANTSTVRGLCVNTEEIAQLETLLACQLPKVVWEKVDSKVGTWIAAPSSANHRWWLVSSEEQSKDVESLLAYCSVGNTQDWYALDIAEGLPWIEAATQDMFIPQTLNLDLIQGSVLPKDVIPVRKSLRVVTIAAPLNAGWLQRSWWILRIKATLNVKTQRNYPALFQVQIYTMVAARIT